MTTLEAVKVKIVEAVPDVIVGYNADGLNAVAIAQYRPITLEDVLRAIGSEAKTQKGQEEYERVRNKLLGFGWNVRWHLGKSLDDQPEDVINFLHSILCA
jgi:DNA polymerase elongation subunit (family B)